MRVIHADTEDDTIVMTYVADGHTASNEQANFEQF
jgi:hypothetical protein